MASVRRAPWVDAIVSMGGTLRRDRTADKIQFRVDPVVRFGTRSAPEARSEGRRPPPRAARAGAARDDPVWPADGGRAPSVHAGAGARAGGLARPGHGVLRAAPGRGVPERHDRLGDAGRRQRPSRHGSRAAHGRVAALGDRLPRGPARPRVVPTGRLAARPAGREPHRAGRRAGLRRPAREPPAARDPRRLPAARARRGGRRGPDRRLHGLRAGPHARAARARPRRRRHARRRGSRRRRPLRRRRALGPRRRPRAGRRARGRGPGAGGDDRALRAADARASGADRRRPRRPSAATSSSRGRAPDARRSSRTTTTPSSATTASRSARCRASRRSTSRRSAP